MSYTMSYKPVPVLPGMSPGPTPQYFNVAVVNVRIISISNVCNNTGDEVICNIDTIIYYR